MKERLDAITKVLPSNLYFSDWNKEECVTFIPKKELGQLQNAKAFNDLQEWCIIVKTGSSLDCSVHDSDESDDKDDYDEICKKVVVIAMDSIKMFKYLNCGDASILTINSVSITFVAHIKRYLWKTCSVELV